MSNKDSLWEIALFSPGRRLRQRLVFKEASNFRGKVLACGCGIGIDCYSLKTKETEPVGIDINFDLVKLAGQINPWIRFCVGNIEEMSFEDAVFDNILACEVLEHTGEDKRALLEIGRVLKAGGKLLLTVPSNQARWCYNALKVKPDDFDHERLYSRASLKNLLLESGFKIEKLRLIQNPFVYLFEIFMGKVVGKISGAKKTHINPLFVKPSLEKYRDLLPLVITGCNFLFLLFLLAEYVCPLKLKTGFLVLARKQKWE